MLSAVFLTLLFPFLFLFPISITLVRQAVSVWSCELNWMLITY